MKPYTFNVVANTPMPIELGGEYFLADLAPGPYTVEFFAASKNKREEQLDAAVDGDWATPKDGFSSIKVTSPTTQAVRFFIGRGRVGRFRVSGSVDVSDRVGRLLGIVYGTLGQLAQVAIGGVNALQFTNRGFAYGASFKSTTALAANTSETVLAVGSNANGAIIWRASGRSNQGAAFNHLTLHAHTAAPNSPTVGDVLASADSGLTAAGLFESSLKLEQPVFVAAGKGIFWNSLLAESNAMRSVLYTVL